MTPPSRAFVQYVQHQMGSMAVAVKSFIATANGGDAKPKVVPEWAAAALSLKLAASLEALEAACHYANGLLLS